MLYCIVISLICLVYVCIGNHVYFVTLLLGMNLVFLIENLLLICLSCSRFSLLLYLCMQVEHYNQRILCAVIVDVVSLSDLLDQMLFSFLHIQILRTSFCMEHILGKMNTLVFDTLYSNFQLVAI